MFIFGSNKIRQQIEKNIMSREDIFSKLNTAYSNKIVRYVDPFYNFKIKKLKLECFEIESCLEKKRKFSL